MQTRHHQRASDLYMQKTPITVHRRGHRHGTPIAVDCTWVHGRSAPRRVGSMRWLTENMDGMQA